MTWLENSCLTLCKWRTCLVPSNITLFNPCLAFCDDGHASWYLPTSLCSLRSDPQDMVHSATRVRKSLRFVHDGSECIFYRHLHETSCHTSYSRSVHLVSASRRTRVICLLSSAMRRTMSELVVVTMTLNCILWCMSLHEHEKEKEKFRHPCTYK